MSNFATSPFEIPSDIVDMCDDVWFGISVPGSGWSGSDRVAIAARARAERLAVEPSDDRLSSEAREAVRMLAATPSFTTQAWVGDAVGTLGEAAYVELVGVVARVVAIDTFTRLVGVVPAPFPQPQPGEPSQVPAPNTVRRDTTWVSIVGVPVPPNALSLVPSAQRETNTVGETLYMTGPQMDDPDTTIDQLHRTQIEVVAASVSHANECFY